MTFPISYENWILLILSSLGLCTVAKATATFLRWVYVYFLRPPKNLKHHYGSWAIVTGSTDGIGKATAFRLAEAGLHLVLVGRGEARLRRVADEIRASSGKKVEVRTVEIDFAGDLAGGVLRLVKTIVGLDVGVLVNNAGTTYPSAMFFHEVAEEVWRNVVRVNVEGLTMVTQAVLPIMLERKRGAIVNVGSGAAAAIPSHPLFAVYAATKAYVEAFSRSLSVEYKKSGIDVQCQIPMYVATKMAPFKNTTCFVPSPDDYAEAAVRRIGYGSKCTPYWTHSLQWWLASMAPECALNEWRLSNGIKRRIVGKDY